MVLVPAPVPVTVTVDPPVPTVATEVLLLVHVPPAVASLSDTDEPLHITAEPRIAVIGFTVTTANALQPLEDNRYVTVPVPDDIPLTRPLVPIVAAAPLMLQVPPDVVSLNTMVDPAHTAAGVPSIALIGFTVTVISLEQPVELII